MLYTNSATSLDRMERKAGLGVPLPGGKVTNTAASMFKQAGNRARLGRVWSALTGRPCRLQRLSDVQASGAVCSSNYAGTRPVPISQIRGSEGRCNDFDAKFRPLRSHNRWRWIGIAKARLQDVTLPPVDLIQVGDDYFVRDGHHRISVARALGQKDIDAKVTVWEVAPQRPAPARQLAAQPA